MIVIKLKEAMESYRRKTGERLTHAILADRSGIARSTIDSIASRPGYNTTLETVEKICRTLHCSPGAILEIVDSQSGNLSENE